MKKEIILLLLSSFIFTCRPLKDPSQNGTIIFRGITRTDDFGNIISVDISDWKITDTLNQKENSLFDLSLSNHCRGDLNNYIIKVYPNPCSDVFHLDSQFPNGYSLSIRIVDRSYKILQSVDNISSKSISFATPYLNISNDTVRIYYKFICDSCELAGHGDVKIN